MTSTVYVLTYTERDRSSHQGALSFLRGPTVFKEERGAYLDLYGYVFNRICDTAGEFLIEDVEGLRHNDVDVSILTPEDREATYEDLVLFLEGLKDPSKEAQMKTVVDWYWDFSDDELVDASYHIDACPIR